MLENTQSYPYFYFFCTKIHIQDKYHIFPNTELEKELN